MGRVGAALWNGFRLRCPHCGTGRIFARFLRVDDGCLECSHVYQRDPGDWTGSAESTVVISAFAALLTTLLVREVAPFEQLGLMWTGFLFWAAYFPLVFRHVKGLWVGLLYVWVGACPTVDLGVAERDNLVKVRG